MFYMYVGSQEHANAVVKYAALIGANDAKSEQHGLTGWYRVELDCELKHRRQLQGFVDGLEWPGCHFE